MKVMLKLRTLKTTDQDEIKRVQNRMVCDVVEYCEYSVVAEGLYKIWVGSTTEEYFNISFLKGLLMVNLEEREINLGQRPVHFAIVSHFVNELSRLKNDQRAVVAYANEYNNEGYLKDNEAISFTDVMRQLKWKKPRNVKVKKSWIIPLPGRR
jgi:hypothetical protein